MLLKKKICILLALCCFSVSRAEKYALIIAIGNYPAKTGWSQISSLNDISLIQQTLLNNSFLNDHIFILKDAEATKAGILSAFTALTEKLKPGDKVVIHYSGHGQQIFDDNGDEIDDLDEAIIPYDAFAQFSYNYKGESHIRDDELGQLVEKLRNKLGQDGQLLLMLDSCHSGTATRGGKARGTKKPFIPMNWVPKKTISTLSRGSAMFETINSKSSAAPFVLISGASADELNYEYGGYGSLSYAFSKAMASLGNNFTFRQLFSKINSIMLQVSPKQTPTIEGDLDYTLFNGEYTMQQPYFEVKTIQNGTSLTLRGGTFQGLFPKGKVLILPAGTRELDTLQSIANGTVISSTLNEAVIELDQAIAKNNPGELWGFVKKPSYGAMNLKVFIDHRIADPSMPQNIDDYLQEHHLGKVVNDSLISDVIVEQDGSSMSLRRNNGDNEIDAVEQQRGASQLEELQEKLATYARGQYLRNLSLKNYAYEIDFRLLKLAYNSVTDSYGEAITKQDTAQAELFQVDTDKDRVVVEVENKGSRPVYITIIEINSKGEINPFFPLSKYNLTDQDRKLDPGKVMRFNEHIYQFNPPFERLTLKAFATPEPLVFTSHFNDEAVRGGVAATTDINLTGFSTEFIYEIVKNEN